MNVLSSATKDFFKPCQQLSELGEKFKQLGMGGTPLGMGVSFVAQQIGVELLKVYGTEAQKTKYLKKLMSGEMIAAVANTEGTGGTDIKSMTSELRISNDDTGLLSAEKICFTNGPADLVFLSAWVKDGTDKPSLEVFLIEGTALSQRDLREELSGFKSGMTGALKVERLSLSANDTRLGARGSGFEILKFCFDLERMMIGALIQGALSSLENLVLESIESKSSFGQPLLQHQWVQEKIILIRKTSEILNGLLQSCYHDMKNKVGPVPWILRQQSTRLSILKWVAVDDGIAAATAALEAGGAVGLRKQNPINEMISDLYHLKFLGGTRELQKSFLIHEILEDSGKGLNEKIRAA